MCQLIFSNNTVTSTVSSTQPIVYTDGQLGTVITGNIRYRIDISSSFVDGRLLVSDNAGANSKFALIGNVLRQTNFSSSNYYRIDGVDVPTGANILASNNV